MSRTEDLRDIDAALRRVGRIGRSRDATRLRAEASGVDVSNPAAGILSALTAHGPLRASALADAAETEPPLVSRELRILAALGYVTINPDPSDGRARMVSLTDDGRAAYTRFRTATDGIIANAFREWDSADLVTLNGLLQRVVIDFASAGRPRP